LGLAPVPGVAAALSVELFGGLAGLAAFELAVAPFTPVEPVGTPEFGTGLADAFEGAEAETASLDCCSMA
jgi:hypothetical protein